ncbi:MAG: transglutaminase domain-containing protein, partial [Muribaculaceae bacterium]|nr:transglutaminase domain-containing protein [Muribaculaceae bacterium]
SVAMYTDFLYDIMPVSDSIDYPRDFWEANVSKTLEARAAMPWGAKIPEREFRHFVLPVRVNNENMDMSRSVFYEELAPRVAGMSMTDAALEVNHWCHEKATYAPSDGRTSSPMATVGTSL